MQLIEVDNARFSYDSRCVFEEISFQVKRGEIFCIIGPNGCGKTTLLDCILGVLKLNGGDIRFSGRSINQMRPHEIARQIAYVPQAHEKTFPYTVLDIVLMGRASYTGMFSSPTTEDLAIAENALELVGISGFRNRPYTQLSGGEVQLVMIARALAQKTPVIIMDEPTAHLDFKHELVVMETIVSLVRETGLALIMATHYPNQAFYLENNDINTRVALMSNKKFHAAGRPIKVLSEENLKMLYKINARVVSCRIDDSLELRQIIPINTGE